MKLRKSRLAAVVVLGFGAGLYLHGDSTYAEGNNEETDFNVQIQEWEEEGIDPNHMEVIDEINAYIDEHLSDSFSSMFIDREERDLGVLVFQFTEPVEDSHQQAMEDLAEDPAEIEIREVDFTEQELRDKQSEIDQDFNAFEDEGISIYHTSADIIEGHVEVGIDPFTEENAEIIYEEYGDDRVYVVEGVMASTLEMSDDSGEEANAVSAETIADETEEEPGFFQRILNFFRNLF